MINSGVCKQIQRCKLTAVLVAVCKIALFFPFSYAQISDYQECSDGLGGENLGENLTAQERIMLMDEHFEIEISDTERCETSRSGGSSSSITGGGAEGQGSSSPSSANGSQTSPNALEAGDRSIAVTSEMQPSSDPLGSQGPYRGLNDRGSNGKEHEALATADNKKALADSILKRAEEEGDLVVKAALMRRYEELIK